MKLADSYLDIIDTVKASEEMEFAGIALPENREGGAFLFGERLFEQFVCKVRMVAVCQIGKGDHFIKLKLFNSNLIPSMCCQPQAV